MKVLCCLSRSLIICDLFFSPVPDIRDDDIEMTVEKLDNQGEVDEYGEDYAFSNEIPESDAVKDWEDVKVPDMKNLVTRVKRDVKIGSINNLVTRVKRLN